MRLTHAIISFYAHFNLSIDDFMSNVIGRFAPSPSGPLHFGSLVAALGSYLSAKSQNGQWLIRMEDIDPPREPEGAAEEILRQLRHYGFTPDGPVLYQSSRSARYDEVLQHLLAKKLAFHCACNRKTLQANNGRCDASCSERRFSAKDETAIRLKGPTEPICFVDAIHGPQSLFVTDDPVLKRRDGLYGYTLAVVTDDWDQGMTEVVRGSDLLMATASQVHLFHALGAPVPRYAHLPLVVDSSGRKLSKQNLAPRLPDTDRLKLMSRCSG